MIRIAKKINIMETRQTKLQQVISLHNHIRSLMEKRDSFPCGTKEHGFLHFEILERLNELYYVKKDFST